MWEFSHFARLSGRPDVTIGSRILGILDGILSILNGASSESVNPLLWDLQFLDPVCRYRAHEPRIKDRRVVPHADQDKVPRNLKVMDHDIVDLTICLI